MVKVERVRTPNDTSAINDRDDVLIRSVNSATMRQDMSSWGSSRRARTASPPSCDAKHQLCSFVRWCGGVPEEDFYVEAGVTTRGGARVVRRLCDRRIVCPIVTA